jgi:hypothetical protein
MRLEPEPRERDEEGGKSYEEREPEYAGFVRDLPAAA